MREAPYVNTEELIYPPEDANSGVCGHADGLQPVRPSASRGYEDCLKTGDSRVYLRVCMTCGHAACCESSPNTHALIHFRETSHPVIRSLEPGEYWFWCYSDEAYLG